MRHGGEEEETAQDPLSSPSALCTLPTGVTSPAPTHSTPSPRPSPASTRARPQRPVLPVAHRQGPYTGHLLATLAPDVLAYKSPLRAHNRTHRIPSKPPDTLSSPHSPSFDVASTADEAPGCGWRHRVRPLLGKQTPGTGGGVPQEPFPPLAIKLCFLYAPRPHRRRRLLPCTPVSSSPSRGTRRRRAVGLESSGSVPIRVT
jgi:hypothetical protein